MIPKSGHRFSDRIMRKRKIEHGINRSGNDERDQNRDHAVLALLAELLWSEWRIGRLYRLAGRLRHRRQSVAVSVLAASEGRQLSPDDVKKLDDQVRSWRELTIIPIRDTRRKLKGAATLVEPEKQE